MYAPVAIRTGYALMAILLLPILLGFTDVALAQDAVDAATKAESAAVGVTSTDLWAPTLRMILGLTGVLALLAALTFVAQRVRKGNAFKSGLIEVVSGVSLGGREKVVLLRVGNDQVLVGMSPSGMRPLHVIHDSRSSEPTEPAEFETYMGAVQS
ncbi:MAG: flagellar biosynthetic protein FliO [Gammaproteobacteria bacterium]|nr:flagellar biosynthetic protein FliO [Gammaproteobacteria bacterium]